ncbi:10235_t:CDS:1 [Scutellospora calospora]|uniref:10235_t:CDS:1 n=1 Tax=Scutellospora calospora TaxID=85575 RepID=A0ACA9KFN3_9GLOM|nr:10235_t:CDS:1 [Scutellospora calospora]
MNGLFKGALGINEKGIKKILACYESGKSHLEAILRQDILKTEPRVTSKCSARDVDYYIYAKLEKMRKEKKKTSKIIIQEETLYSLLNNPLEIQQHSLETLLPMQVEDNERPRCRITTEAEKNVLSPLFKNISSLLISEVIRVFEVLNMISPYSWTVDRIRIYWRNNRNRR